MGGVVELQVDQNVAWIIDCAHDAVPSDATSRSADGISVEGVFRAA